jgi:hypothetical protein
MMISKRRIVQETEHDIDIREVGHHDIGPQRWPAISFVLPYGKVINEITAERMGNR